MLNINEKALAPGALDLTIGALPQHPTGVSETPWLGIPHTGVR